MKKSFIIYQDQFEPIKEFSYEQMGELFFQIFKYQCDVDPVFRDPMVKMAFSFFKQTFDRDSDKYLERCVKNKANAHKRWDKKDATAYDRMQSNAKHADSDSVSDNESDKDIPPLDLFQNEPFYLTKKNRKLKNKRLETFEQFWLIFNYKKSKSNAADSWYDIPELTDTLTQKIYTAAANESKKRDEKIKNGQTPKMAQGWLTERRWEDEDYKPKQPGKVPTTL